MQPLAEEAARLFGIRLSPLQEAQMQRHAAELALWNRRVNLTAITDPQQMRVRHYLDSLSVAAFVPLRDGMRLIDVGTGAGFPGLPLHLLCPATRLTLLDATAKKLRFLDHVIATLGLMMVIFLIARPGGAGAGFVAPAVGMYIGGAYFFTSSTSFANPAVTIARMFSDTFAGMAPASAPGFIIMQLVGAVAAFLLVRHLVRES